MSVRVRGMLVAIVSVVLVIVSTMAVAERQSPGPVAVVHARLPELAGGDACSSCHGGWFGDMQAACLECHGDIAAQMEEDRGLHGIQPDARVRACATCHSDHHGGEFRMVNRLAFSQAGVADPQNFDHRIIGFELGGAHTELVCSECHEHADAEVLPAGAKRFLGLSRDCASCHDDPHEGRMQLACDACHSQDVFTSRAVPNHDRWLQLVGPHAQAECRTCHAGDTEHALERLQSGMQAGRACGDCHESPHTEQFAAGNARASGLPPVAGCVVCHPVVDERFEQPSFRINPTHHAHTGFALTAPHHQVACDDCHPSGLTFAERHPGRESDDCGACHTDPHDGQFDAAPLAKDGCISCHARTQFAPHAFDAEMHARTRLPLAGRHAELPCSDCHRIEEEGRARTFHGTPNRCESCHADAHEDTFAVRAAPANAARLAAEPRGKCATCHV
ncbi:MAG TPA: hypothetical protein ENI87_02790, partial [bacterium]|nr:hypothetical protein [bacterium]